MSHEIDSRTWRNRRLGAAVTVLVSGFVFWTYHNRFWYAPDEGNYAHVAQRVLSGEVLNRDVQDLHMGYVNFANAGWMWLFGERLLSLRYPLIAIGVFSALIAFLLTSTDSVSIGITSALIVTTLSILQFLNPTAHWYCFGLVWAIVAILTWQPAGSRGRLFLIGFLVGLVFLFRQLTGVIVAMGVLTYLFSEATSRNTVRCGRAGPWAARLLCAIMFCGLLGYLLAKTDGMTLLIYGSWPLGLLAFTACRSNIAARSLAGMLGALAGGALLAAAPLIAYHALHGSIPVWLADTVFRAESLTRLDFINKISFPRVMTAAGGQLLAGGGVVGLVNALFWILTLSAAPLLGLWVLSAARRPDVTPPLGSPLIVVALFYGIVSLHYQIPIYLFYSLSLTLVALLQIARLWSQGRSACVIGGLALAIIGLHCHAAQPLTRSWDEILGGAGADDYVVSSNPRCGLAVPPGDDAVYAELCSLIDENCAADDPILALPSNAEIYFLSGRRNPFRFFNSALALAGEDEVQSAINKLRASPPRLVFFHPGDKYNTSASNELMDWVRGEYEQLPAIGEFEVYRQARHPIAAVN
jgi:hypothetical protein